MNCQLGTFEGSSEVHGVRGDSLKITAAFAVVAVLLLPACNQMRADDLQRSIDNRVAGGYRQKDDFIRQFGVPTSCVSLTTGELCQWDTEQGYQYDGYMNRYGYSSSSAAKVSDEIRIEFDKSGNFVKGSAFVQRGRRTYQGESAQ